MYTWKICIPILYILLCFTITLVSYNNYYDAMSLLLQTHKCRVHYIYIIISVSYTGRAWATIHVVTTLYSVFFMLTWWAGLCVANNKHHHGYCMCTKGRSWTGAVRTQATRSAEKMKTRKHQVLLLIWLSALAVCNGMQPYLIRLLMINIARCQS